MRRRDGGRDDVGGVMEVEDGLRGTERTKWRSGVGVMRRGGREEEGRD